MEDFPEKKQKKQLHCPVADLTLFVCSVLEFYKVQTNEYAHKRKFRGLREQQKRNIREMT